jgi:hypothetical protein
MQKFGMKSERIPNNILFNELRVEVYYLETLVKQGEIRIHTAFSAGKALNIFKE